MDENRMLLKELNGTHVTVSLTSYPDRINSVENVIRYLMAQSYKPHRIVLYLAKEQFTLLEKELPDQLNEYIAEGILELRWCEEDLKCHKKYFYVMREYPDDIIITVDDDMELPPQMIEELLISYLAFPNAVSARRAHLVTFTDDMQIRPYNEWIMEVQNCARRPSLQFMATGCGGVLYPPHLFDDTLYDVEGIKSTCLYADDLWLKAHELLHNIPVVIACEHMWLRHMEGTQETALRLDNQLAGGNDRQLKLISEYFSRKYGVKNYIREKITQKGTGYDFTDNSLLIEMIFKLKEDTNRKLQQIYAEKSEINKRLKEAYVEKSEINKRLKETYVEKSEINRKLQQTYKEKAERGVEINNLKHELAVSHTKQKEQEEEIKKLRNELSQRTFKGMMKRVLQKLKRVLVH